MNKYQPVQLRQDKKAFLNCRLYLISSYLSEHYNSHCYAFSSCWSTYIDKHGNVGSDSPTNLLSSIERCVEDIYDIEFKGISPEDSKNYLLVNDDDLPIFLLVDSFYIPWMQVDYKKNHNPHYLLVTAINEDQCYVVDHHLKYRDWVSKDLLILAIPQVFDGESSFVILKGNEVDLSIVDAMASLSKKIEGSSNSYEKTGLYAIEELSRNAKDKSITIDQELFYSLSDIGSVREATIEYFLYLKEEKNLDCQAAIECIDSIVSAWYGMRNSIFLKHSRKKDSYPAFERLTEIMELEKELLCIVNEMSI